MLPQLRSVSSATLTNSLFFRCMALISLLFLWSAMAAQQGNYDVKVFSPQAYSSNDYVTSPQNIEIIQGNGGLMYVANASGILEYDGFRWRMIPGSSDAGIRGFVKDSSGVIYCGGNGELGYIAPDTFGKMAFHSLVSLLAERDRDFGIIYNTYGIGNSIFFLSRKQLMLYTAGAMQIWKAKTRFLGGYVVNDSLYIEQENMGLMKMVNNEIKVAIADEDLADSKIMRYFSELCPCTGQTTYIVGKGEYDKFFLFNGTEAPIQLNPEISAFLQSQLKVKAVSGLNGTAVIGTLSEGVVVISNRGEPVRWLKKEDGLPDNTVNALCIDTSGGLWIGHDIGISRIQLNSPFTYFNSHCGYSGVIVSVLPFKGRLYLSTTDGVYAEKERDNPAEPLGFQRITDIPGQSYTLLEAKGSLLVATIHGVFEIKGFSAERIAEGIALDLFPYPPNSSLVLAGLSDGIMPLEYQNERWKAEAHIAGLSDAVARGIADSSGVIWAANHTDKIYRIDFSNYEVANPRITELDSTNNTPKGWIEPVVINGVAYFGTALGVYEYDAVRKKFIRTQNPLFNYFNTNNREAGPIKADAHGNIWVVAHGHAGKLIRQDSGIVLWDSTATLSMPQTTIWSISFDENDIVWLGTTDYLARYDTKRQRKDYSEFPVYVRQVTAGNDSTLFWGAGKQQFRPQMKFQYNDFAFEFAAPFFEGVNYYSVKLEGNDKEWSEWSTETKVRYTNLHSGNFVFKVKAGNIYGFETPEATYSFTILPPFYFTDWAFLAYALLVALAVWGIVKFNSRRLTHAKKRLEKIVEERTQELSAANHELQQAKEFEEQFLANMSHEIRTPMNSVVGLTNLMLHTEVNPKQRQYLDAIRQSADNMLVILNDILDISKIQAGKLEIDETDFSPRAVIHAALGTMQLSIAEKKLQTELKIDAEVPEYVLGDPVRLHQIILNLINNAVKFTDKGVISITCHVLEKSDAMVRLEFTVRDTGIGIPTEKAEKIFDSFQQGGREIARKYGGTGLGLSICKELVEMQHGSISVKSEAGRGAAFTFDILYQTSWKEPDQDEIPKTDAADTRLEGLKILLVENNELHKMVAKDTLEVLVKDASVDTAENGKVAVEALERKEYGLVLMDLNMPEMNGYETARKIRSALPAPRNKVKIIAMSASSTKMEREECIASGMNDFIAKPFRMEELALKLRQHCANAHLSIQTVSAPITQFGTLDEITGNNDEKKRKYINMYRKDAPVLMQKMKEAIAAESWKEIRDNAHSLLPHFHLMGAISLKKLAEEIEIRAKKQEALQEIQTLSVSLENGMRQTLEELKYF